MRVSNSFVYIQPRALLIDADDAVRAAIGKHNHQQRPDPGRAIMLDSLQGAIREGARLQAVPLGLNPLFVRGAIA